MAKSNEQFDQHFKEKLEGHQEKPSALAWERLESQLPKSSKPTLGIWWAVAASVTALLMAGYSFWPSDESISTEILVAEKTEIPLDNPIEITAESPTEVTETIAPETQQETTSTENQPEIKPKQKTKPSPTPVQSQTPQNLIAQTETKDVQTQIIVPVPAIKTEELVVAMPELKAPDLEKTIAQTSEKSDEEPLYRVNIYSNGVKKGDAPDKNLINELGKTVGQVEGFLGKVDDSLFGLQDKKDNLFTSLVSKKNQGDERR